MAFNEISYFYCESSPLNYAVQFSLLNVKTIRFPAVLLRLQTIVSTFSMIFFTLPFDHQGYFGCLRGRLWTLSQKKYRLFFPILTKMFSIKHKRFKGIIDTVYFITIAGIFFQIKAKYNGFNKFEKVSIFLSRKTILT